MRTLRVVLGLGFLLGLTSIVLAQEADQPERARVESPRLGRVVISGNRRVEEEAIRVQLRSQPGMRFNEETVDNDVRALYRMGFFENVEADLAQEDNQWVLTYRVSERPLIKEIKIEGNKKVNREDIEGALKVRPNTILEPDKVSKGIEEAKKVYEKKGYLDAQIEYSTSASAYWKAEEGKPSQVILTYKITEGKRVRITKFTFEGARAFSQRKLKGVMQTKEKWFLSWLTGAGNLDNEVLKTDIERLTAFYYDHGYIDVRIDEPVVRRTAKGLEVTIKLDEGTQYKVGKVNIGGDMLADADMEKARKKLGLKTGEIFRTSKLREDINAVTDIYGDEGYAFVNVNPETEVDHDAEIVNVTYRVSKGPEVYIDKIDITGNTKTRDKVVRRELELGEQQRFSGSKLRRSQERLRRLGYFEDVNITTRKAESEDRLDLLVDVKEASTGSFSAGAGVASGESFLFNVRLQEINLFGRGQRLTLNTDYGSIRRNISLDFTEPYFLDTEFTTGVSIFNWQLEFDNFTRGGTGGSIRVLYPFTALGWNKLWGVSLQDTRFGMDYRIEDAEIKDVSPSASAQIRTEQGSSLTSAITPRLYRDTRNHPFDPTDGSLQDLSVEFAGLGGDSEFIKADLRLRFYYPFYRSPTFGTFTYMLGSTIGYGYGFGGDNELPLFERYFPGGINSVRGFKILSLGPRNNIWNSYAQLEHSDPVGGSQQLVFNNEIIFPVVEQLGLKGVVFFDTGNAFSSSHGMDLGDMRMSFGAGVRWQSPMGPLRIEFGIPINSHEGDDTETVMFSFGGPP
ncbi:MAG: yaeT [Deltaproteobacteria bacterium]|nr:yaeT [Deltaproteobacteria bacterium]